MIKAIAYYSNVYYLPKRGYIDFPDGTPFERIVAELKRHIKYDQFMGADIYDSEGKCIAKIKYDFKVVPRKENTNASA